MSLRRPTVASPRVRRSPLRTLRRAAVLLALGAGTLAAQHARPGRVILRGGTVIDVATGERRAGVDVVVASGHVERVVPSATLRRERGDRIVDVKGSFVIPGLWDMHVEQALPLHPGFDIDSGAALMFPLFIAHGVTGVRDVAGSLETLGRWKREVDQGTRVGPRMIVTGPKLSPRATNATRRVTTAAEGVAAANALRLAGAQAIYISDIDGALHQPLIDAMRGEGLAVEGTLPSGTTLWTAAERGQRVVDHFDGALLAASRNEGWARRLVRWNAERPLWLRALWKLGLVDRPTEPGAVAARRWNEERALALARHLATHRTYQVPTLRLLGTLLQAGDSLLRLPPSPLELRPPKAPWNGWETRPVDASHPRAETWRAILRTVGIMQRAGVPIMAASDAPNLYAAPGLALHDELGLLVRAGLTPLQALRAATLTPAEYMGATDTLGTVAAGRVADILILDADPTLDIAHTRRIRAVMARGRLFERRALDSLEALGVLRAREVERHWIADRAGKGQ